MKTYLRIRDYGGEPARGGSGLAGTLFGIDLRERNFERIRVAGT